MLDSNIAANVPMGLNYKAYEQEMPRYPTINQPQGSSATGTSVQKESLKNNPVFNMPGTMSTNNVNNQELKTSNVRQVWGSGGAVGGNETKPAESVTSHYNQGNLA